MAAGALSRIAADLGACLRFFSRVPVPRLSRDDDPAAAPDFSRSAGLVPLAGAVICLPAALVAAILANSALPPVAAGALVLLAAVLVTGALHEDGLADTADGLGGAHSRERRLEIMRDSRIGVFGAAALGVAIVLRASLYGALLEFGSIGAAAALIAVAAGSRAAMVAVWHALPPARSSGLSAGAGRPSSTARWLAIGVGGVLLLLALPAGGIGGLALGIGLAMVAAASLGYAASRLLGGQTGDILGAVQQCAEVALLVGLVA
jgi:adenosylcobinamide-GDP ribazoletransferase